MHSRCETPNHKAANIFFYLENILKFSSALLNIVSKQKTNHIFSTYHNDAFWKYVKT